MDIIARGGKQRSKVVPREPKLSQQLGELITCLFASASLSNPTSAKAY